MGKPWKTPYSVGTSMVCCRVSLKTNSLILAIAIWTDLECFASQVIHVFPCFTSFIYLVYLETSPLFGDPFEKPYHLPSWVVSLWLDLWGKISNQPTMRRRWSCRYPPPLKIQQYCPLRPENSGINISTRNCLSCFWCQLIQVADFMNVKHTI